MNGFYKFAISVLRVVMPLWYKLDTEGLENIPEGSGYLFVSNHRSNADPILIGVQNPQTQFCFLAKQELFSDGLVGWLLRKLGAVAVDRGAGDVTALEEIEYRLQNGQNALIFPEGTRSKDGKLGHFKTGAALIAAQTGVPVVPVAISFDDELHFRSTIHIRYGAPFDIPTTTADDPEPAVLKQVRKEMTNHVSALLELNEQALAAERAALPDLSPPDAEEDAAKLPEPADQTPNGSQNADEAVLPAPRKLRAGHLTDPDPPDADDHPKKQTHRESAKKVPEPVRVTEHEKTRKSEEREQTMNKNHHDNPAENDAEKNIVKETEETVSSVTGELEDIISGVEKSADDVSEKVHAKKEKAAKKAEKTADAAEDAVDDAADDLKDAADDAVDEVEPFDPDEDVRRAMAEAEAEMGIPFKLRNPFKKKNRAADDEDLPAEPTDNADEDYDDDDMPAKGGLLGGLSLKNPFKKRQDDFDDEMFDEDDQDFEDMDEEYADDKGYADDEEYDDEEGHRLDYGRIALILTFVILGIFAFDFARRLINDWRSDQGTINIQSHESSMVVESMNEVTTEAAKETTAIAPTTKLTIEITSETTTATSTTDPAVTTVGTTFLDNRPTETLAVANEAKRSGCLTLIDNDHQQIFTPNLVSFSQFAAPVEHLRMVSPVGQKVDAQLAAPLKNMFNDFFTATGIGNVMVYNTTDTPAYPPYSISLPERSTGLTLDFAILNEAAQSHAQYTPDGNYSWLTEHACDYGFIVRYPAGKEEKTGQSGITWHFRYVGAPHAKYMYDNNLCLEEYLELVAQHPWNSQHLTTTVAGITYEMYYVPASETTATTEIQYPVDANGAQPMISGDNVNGFVVACVRG